MISYLECFKPFSILEGTLGAKIELEIDLTFSLLTIAIQMNCLVNRERTLVQLAVQGTCPAEVAEVDYERLGD